MLFLKEIIINLIAGSAMILVYGLFEGKPLTEEQKQEIIMYIPAVVQIK